MLFNELLRRYRLAVGLSQRRLAELVDINSSHYSRIESGQKNPPKRNTVLKLAQALSLGTKQRQELFKCAGYSAPVQSKSIGYSSPLRSELSARRLSMAEKMGRLNEESQRALKEVVDILSDESLSSNEVKLICRQIKTLASGLKTIVRSMKSNG